MNLAAVFVGGLIGTGLRLGIDALLPHGDDSFPWSTLLINVAGSFALGMLVARVWPLAPEWLRLGLGTGLLGSFTTFSALVASAFLLTGFGKPLLTAVYVVVTVIGGIGAALLGVRIGHRPVPPIGPDE
jgi:CrcB protein